MANLGRYVVTSKLGEGGMGAVYAAQDPDLLRHVAIKVIKGEALTDPQVRARFDLEAKAAGMLKHAGIVTIYDRGEIDGHPFIVMEMVEGRPLDALLADGPLPLDRTVAILRQVAAALDYAHARRVVHRDIKPPNIMVQHDGTAKIMDFGIATTELSGRAALTTVGQIAGSPYYVPPERYTSTGPATGAVDQWALAVTAYKMLTGRTPFAADTWERLIYQVCNDPMPEPAGVPAHVADALRRALSKKPEERFPDCASFVAALEPKAAPAPVAAAAPPPVVQRAAPGLGTRYAGIGAGVGLIAALAWYLTSQPPAERKTGGGGSEEKKVEQQQETVALPEHLSLPSGDMVLVPAGEAQLGEGGRQRTHVAAFYIDKTEVAAGVYRQFCQETGRAVSEELAEQPATHPVVNVTFDEARAFASWAGKRLPSAAEWEKAARGAEGGALPWRGEPRADAANLPVTKAGREQAALADVGAFAAGASPYGALQMLGNVWEWTVTAAAAPPPDVLRSLQAKQFKTLNPPLSETDPFQQLRGGSFWFETTLNEWPQLIWDHNRMPARARRADVGFRCARDASSPTK
ncbi:MAG: SUMF1/EgtB/PvdO family nonheme iron enzyme [Bryobacterales bacterium]|nr:SUMF1/EgtB/PvdO family nonheme iron enzyme [Bryobacterales bacterium]